MSSAFRVVGMAIVALLGGVTQPAQQAYSSADMSGVYEWTMLDREQYAAFDASLPENGRPTSGRLILTRSVTGYDASMSCDKARKAKSFLVVVADDRLIVYAATEFGELRFDVPRTDKVRPEWTLRTSDGMLRSGRLEISRV